jgi:antitoxin VapB
MNKPKTTGTVDYREAMRPARKSRSKTFRNGGSTAVRIPKEFNLGESEVMISRVAEGILIKPVPPALSVSEWWDTWEAMPDFMADGRHQPAAQVRDFGV